MKDNIPNSNQVKNSVTIMNRYEESKFKMKDKENIIEKRWGILKDHYDNN